MQRSAVGAATYAAVREVVNGVALAGRIRLPSERELAARFGVSRGTIRDVLIRLADEGRVVQRPQRGWFLPEQTLSEPIAMLQSFTEMAHSRGLTASAEVISHAVRPASFREAELLRIAPTAEVIEFARLRRLDDVPICLDRTVLPLARVPQLAGLDMTDRSLIAELAERASIRIDRSSYALQALGADAEQARLMGIAPASPMLVADEIAFDSTQKPVFLGRIAWRGDAYRFETTLFRGG